MTSTVSRDFVLGPDDAARLTPAMRSTDIGSRRQPGSGGIVPAPAAGGDADAGRQVPG